MSKEERILDALGSVNELYILEASRYVGNRYGGRIVKPKRHGLWNTLGIAAMLAVTIAGALFSLFFIQQEPPKQANSTSLSYSFLLDGSSTIRMDAIAGEDPESHAIERLIIYRDGNLIQEITADDIADNGIYLNEGLFINTGSAEGLPDFRDVNFDGYADVGLLAVSYYPHNIPYNYFLWDEVQGRFTYGFTIFGGAALRLDAENQFLEETEYFTGNGEQNQKTNLYAFENGKLTAQYPPFFKRDAVLPPFSVNYDPYAYQMETTDTCWVVRPLGMDAQKDCQLTITFLQNTLPWAAAKAAQASLEQTHKYVTGLQQDPYDGFWFVCASDGNELDSSNYHNENVLFVSAGLQGTYQLTVSYYQEDAAAYEADFWSMMKNCEVQLPASENSKLEEVIIHFADAYFSGNFSEMTKYMVIDTISQGPYPGDGSTVRVMNLCGIDVDMSGTKEIDKKIKETGSANISITFLETPDADSYTSLWMNIHIVDGAYRIYCYGLEK